MKWLSFTHAGADGFGTLEGDTVHVHEGELFGEARPTGRRVPIADITWRTPCRPSKMIALWNNFHALAQKNGWALATEPLYLIKTPNSYAAHGEAIPAPLAYNGRVSYEGELTIVIGKRARGVSVEAAPAHIFGYTCGNDVTAMEIIARDAAFAQWCRAKSFDGFGVFGPVIETDFDWHNANVITRVGGRERQNYALADMVFSPAQIVSAISLDLTLEPGDVIMCGTSLGVLPMKPGSSVEVEIGGIGTLANRFAPEGD